MSLPAAFALLRRPAVAGSLAALSLGLAACGNQPTLRVLGGSDSRMAVSPPSVSPPPVFEPSCWSFFLTIRGRDELVGLRWLPTTGSRLDVDQDMVQGAWEASPDGGQLRINYTLRGRPRTEEQLADTGLPSDSGLLRLFFRELPEVDVWVDVPGADNPLNWVPEAEECR